LCLVFAWGTEAQDTAKPADGPRETAGSFWTRETLTGDWGGVRKTLADRGVEFTITYKSDVLANVSGGVRRRTEHLGNVDLILDVDAEKLVGWKGGSLHIYGLNDHGGNPSQDTGAAQGTDNIEAYDTTKLYEAWAQQSLFGDRVQALFGLYDLNSEFDVIETSRLFLNPSQGIGPDISQTGANGPSIFPNASLGGRVKLQPTSWLYVQCAILDSIAGNPENPCGTQIMFGHDGRLVVSEAGVLLGKEEHATFPFGKYAIGGWVYSDTFEDVRNPARRGSNHGIYGFAEQTVYREAGDPRQGLALFVRVGEASPDVNQFDLYLGGGAVFTGLIPRRDEDQLGLAVACARNGGPFREAAATAGTPVDKTETILEATYRIQWTPFLAIQPDFQYTINPGTDPTLRDSVVVGARLQVDF
jgi:porin